MKRIVFGLVGLFIASQLFVSCSSESEVLGQFSKRKYLKKHKAKNVKIENKVGELDNEVAYESAQNNMLASKEESVVVEVEAEETFISEVELSSELIEQVNTVNNHGTDYSGWNNYNRDMDFSKMDNYHNSYSHEMTNSISKKNSRASEFLIGIFCFFIPPVGVILYEDTVTTNFWVDLVGTLLIWFPGMILAFLICFADVSF
jgi:uncharacterized membrane protein YqaE (UPF0057 family)